ncbi:ECF RNA polymerase sigma factor SigH [Clostridiales bacterium]|nr:ECF RNA polymerase sigma factor SigH [Clostridiales bacterium]
MNKQEFTQRVLEAEPSLYRVAKSIVINEKDCEDAVQEALLTAYDKLSSLREEQYFKTWLTRILINECYRVIKKRKAVVSFEEYMEGSYEDGVDTELRDAIMELPQKIRTAVVLHYIEGYGIEEASYIMKVPSGTFKSRLHKGRKLLRDTLNADI